MSTEKAGEQIAVLSKAKGLTQSELGERIGVSFQAVSKWERGELINYCFLLSLYIQKVSFYKIV